MNLNHPRQALVSALLPKNYQQQCETSHAFAPANIALCKYWGKRDSHLNLPLTSSLSISLGNLGANTSISSFASHEKDQIILNNEVIESGTFVTRISDFLDLFRRSPTERFKIETTVNIPVAAGLASSAAGFAALTLSINQFYQLNLTNDRLSCLARLGSGSACRSLWPGFVEWQKGTDPSGMDSHGFSLNEEWPNLRIGILLICEQKKAISSRIAMAQTKETSPLYDSWENVVEQDLKRLKQAIKTKDFELLGQTSEQNAMTMHALMMSAYPAIVYFKEETIQAWHKVWHVRKTLAPLYFTADAGPNLKLLFLAEHEELIRREFPNLTVVAPFTKSNDIDNF